MIKREELTNPNSCTSRARDDEYMFVLLGRDICSPGAIRHWAADRVWLGKNKDTDPQIVEARKCAVEIERELYPFEMGSPQWIQLNARLESLRAMLISNAINYEEAQELKRLHLAAAAVLRRSDPAR